MNEAPDHAALPRSKWLSGLLRVGSLLAVTFVGRSALAQADISPPPPDVLLLVDTSGSMDYKTASNSFPTCRYSGTTSTAQTSERSRWIDLVEVLTGSISSYDCQRLDRNSAGFRSEYALSGQDPYDFLYANPYHRPASNGCVAGPGTLDPINKALFPSTAIKYHPFDNTAGSCNFNQATDGILDAFAPDVRFGLMTFDTDPRANKDVTGLWSYYVSSPTQGQPAGCAQPQDQEVGVRNTDAPPWEGRAIGFGNPALGSLDYKNRNDMIQKVLLATRPYGATPIAGMLDDARAFFFSDVSADPLDPSFKFGPANDPAIACRHRSIILLSDGQPNMDLRTACEGPTGKCPYLKPEDIAQDLKSKGIETYVIGFALPTLTVNGSPKACKDIDATSPTSVCNTTPGDSALQACCALNRIAAAGGHEGSRTDPSDPDWTRARFADDRDQLRSALSQAIGGNFTSTTRTPFVNASGAGFLTQSSDPDFARSFRFSASFRPGKLDKPWVGELNRGRYVCQADSGGVLAPKLLPPDSTKGDKFVDNVNASGPAARQIYTVLGNAPIVSDGSIRPNLPATVVDGVGTYSGTMNSTLWSSLDFASKIPAEAIRVTDTTCDSSTVNLDATQCRDRYLKWLVGLDNGTVFNRCPSVATGKCNLISEIYHSIPRAVPGRPAQFLIDSTYQKFVKDYEKRPSILYASSNDGFLHAFKISRIDKDDPLPVTSMTTNELWAFVPPGVLPGIPALYPASHQLLLDGTPYIKEVVATRDENLPGYKYRLERTLAQTRDATSTWRTILVQSFGAQRPGYFALDITDPLPSAGGPKFLWQLATDKNGRPLFGSGGATPLITTVYLNGTEVAVAVLPGGYGSPGTADPLNPNQGCKRHGSYGSWPNTAPAPRDYVPCYTGTAVAARSVTVVRLDSGEVLRTFRFDDAEVPGLPSSIVKEVPLDSPMTGQPVAYPPDVGAVADRVFIGDQDGGLWRVNFTSEKGKVEDWNVDLFFDGFPKDSPYSHDWNDGQPIIAAPVMSVDDVGHLTIALSTGDQEAIGASPGLANYVYSITEQPNATRTVLSPHLNWSLDFKGTALSGDRVVGEMALFSGDLFFATVGPGTTSDACSSGSGKVWGMHYLQASAAGQGKGGRVSPTLTPLISSGGYVDTTTLLGTDAHAYLSGVSVAQQPTCEAPGTINDPGYTGYGVVPVSSGGSGKFQLIIPTGDRVSTSTKPGINVINNGGANAVAIDLPTPAATLMVDSWAAIVE